MDKPTNLPELPKGWTYEYCGILVVRNGGKTYVDSVKTDGKDPHEAINAAIKAIELKGENRG